MPLPALVLTAGVGSRLDPITRLVAKPAVPLRGRSLVEHVLAWLHRQGVRDAVLNLHRHPASLTTIVGDGAHLGFRVRYSWEREILGSAGGPRRALPLLDADPFLIVNGDTLCDLELEPMVAAHAASGADVTLAVTPNREPDRYNGVIVDDAGVVRGFAPRGQAAHTWHFVGVQVAQARAFAALADGVYADTVAGIYRDVIASAPGRIRAWRIDLPFLDVGSPADYLRADAALRARESRSGDAVTSARTSAGVTNSIIWPDVILEPGVSLTHCIVAGPVHLRAGFRAEDAIVVPASIVESGDDAEVRGDVAVFPLSD